MRGDAAEVTVKSNGFTAHVAHPCVAIAFGALDVRGDASSLAPASEVVLLPALPSGPIELSREPVELWRRLVTGPVDPTELSDTEHTLLDEFVGAGIASPRLDHPARITRLDTPWIASPLHDLATALVTNVARSSGVETVVIKGPVLNRQGLRSRKHSGDVDVWVAVGRVDHVRELVAAAPLATHLEAAGVEAGPPSALPENWEWYSKSSPSRGYPFALRSIPWRHRPRVLWRVLCRRWRA